MWVEGAQGALNHLTWCLDASRIIKCSKLVKAEWRWLTTFVDQYLIRDHSETGEEDGRSTVSCQGQQRSEDSLISHAVTFASAQSLFIQPALRSWADWIRWLLTKLPAGVSNDAMTFPSQGWICPEICHVNPRWKLWPRHFLNYN